MSVCPKLDLLNITLLSDYDGDSFCVCSSLWGADVLWKSHHGQNGDIEQMEEKPKTKLRETKQSANGSR